MVHIHLGFLQHFLFLGLALGSGQIYSGVKKAESDEPGWITAFELSGANTMRLIVSHSVVVENASISKWL